MTHILVRQKKQRKKSSDKQWLQMKKQNKKNKQLLPIYDMWSHSDKAHVHT